MIQLKSQPLSEGSEGMESRGKPVSSGPTDTQPSSAESGQLPPTDANPTRQHFQLAGGTAK